MTQTEANKALAALLDAFYSTVKESPDGAPAGPMYAAFMAAVGMRLDTFELIADYLIQAGKIKRVGHVFYAI